MVVVGWFKGGMGYVNVVVLLIFLGMLGLVVVDVVGIGKIIIFMMICDG